MIAPRRFAFWHRVCDTLRACALCAAALGVARNHERRPRRRILRSPTKNQPDFFLEEDSLAFLSIRAPSGSLARRQRDGIHAAHAHPERRDPARHGRPRRARLRHDRQRQDSRLPASDPAPPDRQEARRDARPHPDPDARAGRPDPGARPRAHGAHASHFGLRLRRCRPWAPRSTRSGPARTSWSRPPGACSTTSASPTRSWITSRSSSSTRRTACSTWGSCRTSGRS